MRGHLTAPCHARRDPAVCPPPHPCPACGEGNSLASAPRANGGSSSGCTPKASAPVPQFSAKFLGSEIAWRFGTRRALSGGASAAPGFSPEGAFSGCGKRIRCVCFWLPTQPPPDRLQCPGQPEPPGPPSSRARGWAGTAPSPDPGRADWLRPRFRQRRACSCPWVAGPPQPAEAPSANP